MLLDPSGGLKYHWTAFYRRRQGAWAPHLRAVRQLLTDWAPRARRLTLVGPSAGYSLPPEFISTFAEVRVLEPDPVARALLTRRFRHVKLEFIARPRDLTQQLNKQDAVLFCNVLGQLSLSPAMEVPDARAEFTQFCERVALLCSWATFHDRLSTDHESVATAADWSLLNPHAQKHAVSRMDVDSLATYFLPKLQAAYEHDAHEWFPALQNGQTFRYWLWSLRADQHHVIEGTYRRR